MARLIVAQLMGVLDCAFSNATSGDTGDSLQACPSYWGACGALLPFSPHRAMVLSSYIPPHVPHVNNSIDYYSLLDDQSVL